MRLLSLVAMVLFSSLATAEKCGLTFEFPQNTGTVIQKVETNVQSGMCDAQASDPASVIKILNDNFRPSQIYANAQPGNPSICGTPNNSWEKPKWSRVNVYASFKRQRTGPYEHKIRYGMCQYSANFQLNSGFPWQQGP